MPLPRHPDARLYYRVGRQRRDEAALILRELELWAAAQYLSGYAVECMFKALVITLTPKRELPEKGDATVEWLKETFGHDLGRLRIGIAQRGAPLPRSMISDFLFVSTWNPNIRYKPGPGDPKEATRFLAAVDSIVRWADERM